MADFLSALISFILFSVAGTAMVLCGNKYIRVHIKDYSSWPIASVEITEIYQGQNPCYVGKIVDKDGYEAICVFDLPAPLNDERPIPVIGTTEEAHVTLYDKTIGIHIPGKKIQYFAHFCNKEYYDFIHGAIQIKSAAFYIVGGICFMFALTSMIFGIINMLP